MGRNDSIPPGMRASAATSHTGRRDGTLNHTTASRTRPGSRPVRRLIRAYQFAASGSYHAAPVKGLPRPIASLVRGAFASDGPPFIPAALSHPISAGFIGRHTSSHR